MYGFASNVGGLGLVLKGATLTSSSKTLQSLLENDGSCEDKYEMDDECDIIFVSLLGLNEGLIVMLYFWPRISSNYWGRFRN